MRKFIVMVFALSANILFADGKNIACEPKEGECISEKDIDENCEELPYTCDSDSVCCGQNVKKSVDRDCQCGKANGGRIIGGQEVSPKNKYPWMVGIHDVSVLDPPYICGGTLINDRYVLSAAHCFFRDDRHAINPEDIKVGLAHHDAVSDDDNAPLITKMVNIKSYIVHENYDIVPYLNNIYTADNDIALVKLEKPLDLSAYKEIRPACLPVKKDIAYDGEKGILAGWGLNNSLVPSPVLLEVTLPILGNYRCSSLYTKLTDGKICAGPAEGGKGGCYGDSGGPLVVKEGTTHVLVGIVSGGVSLKCGQILEPTVFTRVTYYLDWIKERTTDAHYCSQTLLPVNHNL